MISDYRLVQVKAGSDGGRDYGVHRRQRVSAGIWQGGKAGGEFWPTRQMRHVKKRHPASAAHHSRHCARSTSCNSARRSARQMQAATAWHRGGSESRRYSRRGGAVRGAICFRLRTNCTARVSAHAGAPPPSPSMQPTACEVESNSTPQQSLAWFGVVSGTAWGWRASNFQSCAWGQANRNTYKNLTRHQLFL